MTVVLRVRTHQRPRKAHTIIVFRNPGAGRAETQGVSEDLCAARVVLGAHEVPSTCTSARRLVRVLVAVIRHCMQHGQLVEQMVVDVPLGEFLLQSSHVHVKNVQFVPNQKSLYVVKLYYYFQIIINLI